MRKIWIFFLAPLFLFAQSENKTPEQIEQELQDAEAQFKRAKEMFNPWYTGPLITPSVTLAAVGTGNTQPYLYVIDNYATFDKERKSIDLASPLVQLKATDSIQTGLTDTVDLTLDVFGQGNWQEGRSGGGFGDISVTLGFCIQAQTAYVPAFKFMVSETFPTGSFKDLNSNGLNLSGIGSGAYSTQFGFGASKIIFWATQHPMHLRLFLGYQVSTTVNVSGFNVYGGGFGCEGQVRPGNSFSADFGYELSLTQRWVAAIDVVYTATDQIHFHGHPGTLVDGSLSSVSQPYQDNLSLSPALEYNWSENLGLIASIWFSVYGRSSLNFVSGVVSLSYSFP